MAAGIDREEVIALWRVAKTHQLRASFEERLWQAAPGPARQGRKRQQYLGALLDDAPSSRYHIEQRGRLLRAPQELWDRVEAGMPLRTAVVVLTRARKRKMDGTDSLEVCVQLELEAYDKIPNTVCLPDGTVIRKRAMDALPQRKPPMESPLGKKSQGRPRSAASFWNKLRREVADYAAERLRGVSEVVADQLWRSLERDLNVLLDDWQKRLYQERHRNSLPVVVVGRKTIVEFCRTLHLDPPAMGGLVDLAQAKRRWKRLANEYHPDRRGESTRHIFEAVKAAWDGIQQYNAQIGSGSGTTTNKENEDGGDAVTNGKPAPKQQS